MSECRVADASARLRVSAEPYDWPPFGAIDPACVALLLIDCQQGRLQRLASSGRAEAAGAAMQRIDVLLAAARGAGMRVVHARQGERPELAASVAAGPGAGVGEKPLVRASAAWCFASGCAPVGGEIAVDHPRRDVFYASDLDLVLATCGITHLMIAGLCADGAVHSTMRSANDRGLDCLLISDAVVATDARFAAGCLTITTMQSGIFGAACQTHALAAALDSLSTS